MNELVLSNHLRECKHSETLRINQLTHKLSKENKSVYRMGFGQSPFPVPEEICKALADANHRKEYTDVQGDLELRKAICDFHQKMEGKDWQEDELIVGSGSKILIFCIFAALVDAEVLLAAPSWVSYEPQAKLAGHEVNWLITKPEQRWRITASELEAYCQQRDKKQVPLVLVLNYPSNPTGQSYSKGELMDLADVMRRYNVLVIADEIYSLLNFESRCRSLQEFYPEGCIVTSGMSKWCGAGGWRLGFCHIPEALGRQFKQAVLGVASETYSCAPTPIQIAAISAYGNVDLVQPFIKKQVHLLKQVSDWCSNRLIEAGVQLSPAQGGFYLFVDFSKFKEKFKRLGITTSEKLTEVLLESCGVALLPGSAFGMPVDSLTARLAFVDFEGEQIWEEGDEPEIEHLKQGIRLICEWLQEGS
jgi:aspartate aminotransferase